MTNAELIAQVAAAAKMTRADVERALKNVCILVKGELAAGNKVAFGDLGIFKPVVKAARTGRNPQNGEAIEIPERRGVKFAPSAMIKKELQK